METKARMSDRLWPRLVFLAVLGGGLLLWTQRRKPRDCALALDLTNALPGEVTGLDVTVRRGGHALSRHEVRYGKGGAPGSVELLVHAAPGEAEVEATLVYGGQPSRRSVAPVQLCGKGGARVVVR